MRSLFAKWNKPKKSDTDDDDYYEPEKPDECNYEPEKSDEDYSDIEKVSGGYLGPEKPEREPRFEYAPTTVANRLFTSIGGKTRLASSKIIEIEYRWRLRWVLIVLLFLIAVLLTPNLLPKWLGFKWSTTSDLCSSRTAKLERLRGTMLQLANITAGERFVNATNAALGCMRVSARHMWGGPSIRRVSYPDECILKNTNTPTQEKTICVGGQSVTRCQRFLGIPIACAQVKVKRRCSKYRATDPDAVRKISELNAQWNAQEIVTSIKANDTKLEQIKETADKKGEAIIQTLLGRVDIASDLYIAYTMFALAIGTPLVIFKRERLSLLTDILLSMTRGRFIVVTVLALSLRDMGAEVMNVNFVRLFHNFQNDPCYLDPEFSRARLDLIRYTCGNVTKHREKLNSAFTNMTRVFYSTQLCEVSRVGSFGPHPNHSLVNTIDIERQRFTNGTYKYPATCNATMLNEATSTPPDNGRTYFQALFGSGVIAQLLLKGILTTFLTDLFAYLEPMLLHRGRVEIFGIRSEDDEDSKLTETEDEAVRSFAKDKKLFPLILSSTMLAFEVLIIGYSIILSLTDKATSTLEQQPLTSIMNQTQPRYTCWQGKLNQVIQ